MNIFQHMLFSTAILLIKLFPYKQTRITHKHVLISKFRSITSRLTSRPVKLSPSEQPLSFLWSCLEKSHRTWSYVRSYRPFVVSRMQTFCPFVLPYGMTRSPFRILFIGLFTFFHYFWYYRWNLRWVYNSHILQKAFNYNELEQTGRYPRYISVLRPVLFLMHMMKSKKERYSNSPLYLMPDSLLDFCTALVLEVLMNLN
jgi:hypothetical protein